MSFLKKVSEKIKITVWPKIKVFGKKLILPLSFFLVIAIISGGLIWWRFSSLKNDFIALPPIEEPPSNSIVDDQIKDISQNQTQNPQITDQDITSEVSISDEPDVTAVILPEPIWEWPIKGQIIKNYGVVYWPTLDDWRMHDGLDIAVGEDDTIGAAAAGRVKSIRRDQQWGNIIILEHGDNYQTVYKGEGSVLVSVGAEVQSLEPIMNITESSLIERGIPRHLHFSILHLGESVNPAEIMPSFS